MSLTELMQIHLPVASELISLECINVDATGDGGAETTFRLLIWEQEGEERTILDVKEQVFRWSAEQLGDPRLASLIAGWAAALGEVFAALSENGDISPIERCLPCDLLDLSVLRLRRSRSTDDFCKALLRPSHLGKFMPDWG
ncbi:MAG TPA: hypothetical protein ENJ18_02050 [Nannocystis exedens]|nr:hypothetical protein [Nannocystis exedens]